MLQLPRLHQCEKTNWLLSDYSGLDFNSKNVNKCVAYAEYLTLPIPVQGEQPHDVWVVVRGQERVVHGERGFVELLLVV